jgi:hypothetical protein
MRSSETVWGNWTGSGNVTLGSVAANQIAFNGSASTTLDMNSHKILDVTNGTAAQDAAAFGQLATAVNAAVSGTANKLAKFAGTNAVGNSNLSDDGTVITLTGRTAIAGTSYSSVFNYVPSGENTYIRGGQTTSVVYVGDTNTGGINIGASGNATSVLGPLTIGQLIGTIITPSLTSGSSTNDWAPTSLSTATTIFANCLGTTCTVTGMTGGVNGRQITIYNTGAGELDLPNGSASSAAADRFNNSNYNGTVVLVANTGCAVQYTYLSSDQFWHETGWVCNPWADNGTTLTGPRSLSTSGNIATTSSGNISSNTYVNAATSVYAHSGGSYLSNQASVDSLGFGYGTNGVFTGYVNAIGYNEGVLQFRNLSICDGKGSASNNCMIQTTGSTGGVTLGDSATSPITFLNGPSGDNTYDGTHLEGADEWLMLSGAPATGSPIGSNYWFAATGTGAGLQTGTQVTGRPGINALHIGTATSGSVTYVLSSGSAVDFSEGSWSYDWAGDFPTLSSSSSSVASMYVAEIGFLDTTTENQVDGCFFAYDKGNNITGSKNAGNVDALECWCAANSVRTGYLINATGNSDEAFALGTGTIVAGTFYRLKIVMTGTTRAEFYRNGTKVCDINTNIPSGSTRGTGFGFEMIPKASTGTGDRTMEVDYSKWAVDLTAKRSP